MTGPRDVIAIQVEAWERDGAAPVDGADRILTALADCGWAVVPAGTTREEWGLRRNSGDVGSVMTGLHGRAECEEVARSAGFTVPPTLVRRTVHYGPWQEAVGEETP